MNYFGPPEFMREDETLIVAPIGASCVWCYEPIQDGDMGTVTGTGEYQQVWHHECSIRSAFGSYGHQRKMCKCFASLRIGLPIIEDPEGLTRREAAIAAAIEAGQMSCTVNPMTFNKVMEKVFQK